MYDYEDIIKDLGIIQAKLEHNHRMISLTLQTNMADPETYKAVMKARELDDITHDVTLIMNRLMGYVKP